MITWRPYRPSDDAGLRARHRRQCEALGISFPFPDLRDPRYLVTEVAERGGTALGAVTAHATIELMFLGGDPLMVRAAVAARQELAGSLRRAGCDEAHTFVPNCVLRSMEPVLRRLGFQRSNQSYTTFYRTL